MEWFNDLIVNNWDKVLAWLSMIPAGALIWKFGNIFVRLIQNWTAKKYTKKQKEYTSYITALGVYLCIMYLLEVFHDFT